MVESILQCSCCQGYMLEKGKQYKMHHFRILDSSALGIHIGHNIDGIQIHIVCID